MDSTQEVRGLTCSGFFPYWPSGAVELATIKIAFSDLAVRTGLPVFRGSEDGRGPFSAVVAQLGFRSPIVVLSYDHGPGDCLVMGDQDHSIPSTRDEFKDVLMRTLSLSYPEVDWIR